MNIQLLWKMNVIYILPRIFRHNLTAMEKKIRNETQGFRSLSVGLMTFNGIKPYYKAVGKIYYMWSYFPGETCHTLVAFSFREGRELTLYSTAVQRNTEKRLFRCVWVIYGVYGLRRGGTRNMARTMISTSSALVYLYWEFSFMNEMKIYHEFI